jgi:hypothetical protein
MVACSLHHAALSPPHLQVSTAQPSCKAVQLIRGSRLYCARLENVLACQCLAPEVPFALHSGHLAAQGRWQACGAHHGHQDYPCEGETSQVARVCDSESALSSSQDGCSELHAGDTTTTAIVLECYRHRLALSRSSDI